MFRRALAATVVCALAAAPGAEAQQRTRLTVYTALENEQLAPLKAAAVLFGFLRSGGINMELEAGVPSSLVLVIQGLIILMLAGAAFWIENRKESTR